LEDRSEQTSRTQIRHARLRTRARRRRKFAVISAASIIVVACLVVGAWLVYRRIDDRPPPLTVYKVTLPEGLTLKQTSGKVEEATRGNISAEEFDAATRAGGYDYDYLQGAGGNLEGFLFPKTYEVTSSSSARSLVNKLLRQFGIETEELEWDRAKALGVTPYQIVVIASIIEKEAKVPGDRPLVASVIYNRLGKGMKLGMCSTVQYALGEPKPVLTNEDLEIDSPYNTYKIDGLPPAPICNPGFESIRAALYPASTDYLYFILTGDDGSHSFTSDYQQFLRWKEEQNSDQPQNGG
jgi:peptidoglycan lytic transglycosylase G